MQAPAKSVGLVKEEMFLSDKKEPFEYCKKLIGCREIFPQEGIVPCIEELRRTFNAFTVRQVGQTAGVWIPDTSTSVPGLVPSRKGKARGSDAYGNNAD